MRTTVRFASLLTLLCVSTLLMLAPTIAEAQIIEGCVDARGGPVASVEDDALPRLALADALDGRATLRYNPSALPRLSIAARAFFYAHECARLREPLAVPAALPRDRLPRRLRGSIRALRIGLCGAVVTLRIAKPPAEQATFALSVALHPAAQSLQIAVCRAARSTPLPVRARMDGRLRPSAPRSSPPRAYAGTCAGSRG